MNLNLLFKQKHARNAAAGLIAIGGLVWFFSGADDITVTGQEPHTIRREDFESWSVFDGTIEAERRAPIYSKMGQSAAILFLAPEGSQVKEGDLVAEFDRSSLDQSLMTLERDKTLAEAELETMIRADMPAELDKVAHDLDKLRYDHQKQERIVGNAVKLLAEGLVSDSELESQQMLLTNLTRQISVEENRLKNFKEVVHPMREAKARAQLEAATRQLALVSEQAESAKLTAPFSGMVVHLPVYVDGEYRNAREGDTIYRNQKVMQIADMDSLLVQCQVPESSVSKVRPGSRARVKPSAFPDLKINGSVDSVGSVAVSVSGRPNWQKFFNVTLRLLETDPRLRSSMTVSAQILSHEEKNTLTIPRGYVTWQQGSPGCVVRETGRWQLRNLELGPANDSRFIVTSGLEEGEVVYFPAAAP